MKTSIYFILLILVVVGCGGHESAPNTSNEPDEKTTHDTACDLDWRIGTEFKFQRWEYYPTGTEFFIDSNRVLDTMTFDGVKTFRLLRDRLDRMRDGVWEVGVMEFDGPFEYGWWQLGSCNKLYGDTIGGHVFYSFDSSSVTEVARFQTHVFVEDTIITVAAGTFHCQGTVYTTSDYQADDFRHYYFFAKGIGLIKSEVNYYVDGKPADDNHRYYIEEKTELLSIRL